MKKAILAMTFVGMIFGSVKTFAVTHGDTTKYQSYYKNGQVKIEGIKVKKFREGLWKYYDKNGKMIRAELYKGGFLTYKLDMSRAD